MEVDRSARLGRLMCAYDLQKGPNDIGDCHREARMGNAAIGISRYTEATLHQGHVEDAILKDLKEYPNVEIRFAARPISLVVDSESQAQERSIALTVESFQGACSEDAKSRNTLTLCRARYLIGCDGAHSWVRPQFGVMQEGESGNSRWGAMDVVPITNFRQ